MRQSLESSPSKLKHHSYFFPTPYWLHNPLTRRGYEVHYSERKKLNSALCRKTSQNVTPKLIFYTYPEKPQCTRAKQNTANTYQEHAFEKLVPLCWALKVPERKKRKIVFMQLFAVEVNSTEVFLSRGEIIRSQQIIREWQNPGTGCSRRLQILLLWVCWRSAWILSEDCWTRRKRLPCISLELSFWYTWGK